MSEVKQSRANFPVSSKFVPLVLICMLSLLPLDLSGSAIRTQYKKSESLSDATRAIFGEGVSVAGLTVNDLTGLSRPELARLYLAAEAPSLPTFLDKSFDIVGLALEPKAGERLGKLDFRAPATTPNESCVGIWEDADLGKVPFKVYFEQSYFDAGQTMRTYYNFRPNDPELRRRKDELRVINDNLALGVSLLPDDLDANGNPIKPLGEIPNFWALDLRQWQRWRGAPISFGWPWVGDVPASGTCPPSWRPAFAYDTTRYPFTNRCVQLRFGTYHYFDETPEDAKGTVLMVHGNPTWSFVYRALAEGLYAAGYRVIAMDYYGYGLSARPDPESFDYMAHDHADSLEEFVQALDLTDLTLVLQDWGGPLGLGMGGHLPSRIKDLVPMNTWAWNVDEDHPGVNHAMVGWSLLNRRNAEVFISTGSFPRGVGNSLGALYGPPDSPEYLAVRNAYWGPFLNLSTGQPLSRAIVRPTNQMAQDLLLDRDFLEETDRNLQALSHKPLYLLFGRLDGNFGALRCDAGAMPPCPLGAACRSMPGGAFCLGPDGAFIYPYVDGFRERWAADKIVEVSIRPTATHFIQEQEVDAIVAAVKRLYHGFN